MENDSRTAQLTQQMMMQMLSQMRAHGGRVEVQHSFQANGEGEGDLVVARVVASAAKRRASLQKPPQMPCPAGATYTVPRH